MGPKDPADLSSRDDRDKTAVGVALAGGRSRRMGRDKANLAPTFLAGKSLLHWTIERLSSVCSRHLVADRGRGDFPNSVNDGKGRGPLAGLLGAADHAPGRSFLVLACDLPLVPVSALDRLLAAAEGADWVVPISAQGPEPLCAVYGPRAVDALRQRAAEGRYSLRDLDESMADLRCRRVPAQRLVSPNIARGLTPDLMFTNMNRPQDVQEIEILAASTEDWDRFLRPDSTKR